MPLDVLITQNVALNDTATNDDTSTVGEPSVAVNGPRIFVSGNWYASRSTDSGNSWTWVDPANALPTAAGGFCCDQLTLYDNTRNIWIWILQYRAQNGTNIFRIAISRDADFPAGGWYWWDIAPATLDAAWTDVWFDYPDASLSADNLYVTFNVFRNQAWQRAVVMRFPLNTLASGGNLGFGWWSTTNNGSLRLTQQANPTPSMYWADNMSGNQLRLFSWPDGSNNINSWDIGVRSWNGTITSTAPNGVNWLARADTRITGGCLGNGVATFMWTAGAQTNPSRPQAYCRVVRINESAKTVIDEPDILSLTRAYAYPAACTNSSGVVGFAAFYGGGDRHPGHIVGARDDGLGTWQSRYSRLGSHSPSQGSWGDYINCRADAASANGWVASGYTLEGGEARQNILPRVVRFRLEDTMPVVRVVNNFGYNAGGWRVNMHPRFMADTTGDQRADIVGFGNAGVYVSHAQANGTYGPVSRVINNFGYSAGGWRTDRHPRFMADTTGNGRADIVGFGNAGVYVSRARANGSFRPLVRVVNNFGYNAGGWRTDRHPRVMADTTGDGRADIVGFGNAGVYVSLAEPDGSFGPVVLVVNNFGYTAGGWRTDRHPRFLADTTGDGRADIVGFGNAGVYVSRAQPDGSFAAPVFVLDNFGYNAGGWRVNRHPRFLADTTGDGRADIVGFGNAGVYVSHAQPGGSFGPVVRLVDNFGYSAGGWRVNMHPRFMADTTGDGRADIVGFGNAGVYVSRARADRTFGPVTLMVNNFGYNAGGWRVDMHPRFLADTNADSRNDIVGFGNAGVYVSRFT
jgi:hypothetical protein